MSFLRCKECGSIIDGAELEKRLGKPSGGASSSFNLFDLKRISPPLTCVHCGSGDLSPVDHSSLSDAGNETKEPSRYHSSTPPVSQEASGKRRIELNPIVVMLSIVGMVVLALVIGLFRTFGTSNNPPISRAVGGLAAGIPASEFTFRVGKLEWQLAPAGGVMDWQAAKIYCDTLSLAGGGWRLPSRDELDALYGSKPEGNAAKPGMDFGSYWSSSTGSQPSEHAWLVNFHYGNTEVENVSSDYAVRCVR